MPGGRKGKIFEVAAYFNRMHTCLIGDSEQGDDPLPCPRVFFASDIYLLKVAHGVRYVAKAPISRKFRLEVSLPIIELTQGEGGDTDANEI